MKRKATTLTEKPAGKIDLKTSTTTNKHLASTTNSTKLSSPVNDQIQSIETNLLMDDLQDCLGNIRVNQPQSRFCHFKFPDQTFDTFASLESIDTFLQFAASHYDFNHSIQAFEPAAFPIMQPPILQRATFTLSNSSSKLIQIQNQFCDLANDVRNHSDESLSFNDVLSSLSYPSDDEYSSDEAYQGNSLQSRHAKKC